jgi:hypothetical protein
MANEAKDAVSKRVKDAGRRLDDIGFRFDQEFKFAWRRAAERFHHRTLNWGVETVLRDDLAVHATCPALRQVARTGAGDRQTLNTISSDAENPINQIKMVPENQNTERTPKL